MTSPRPQVVAPGARWIIIVGLAASTAMPALTSSVAAQTTAASVRRAAALPSSASPRDAEGAEATQAVLKRYCVSCHSERLRTGGLSLQGVDASHVAAQADVWEKVLVRLRSASMPPAGSPRPDPAIYTSTSAWLETTLDRSAAASPNPGRLPPVHRLNRAEYRNALRDLLALEHLPKELAVDSLLPVDDVSYGFDNMADALGTSPTLLERYVLAAQKMAALAVGDLAAPVIVDRYRVPLALPQDDRFDELPFGSRGGFSVRRFFPLDGEYVIQAGLATGRVTERHQLEIAIDGERVQLATLNESGPNRGSATPGGLLAALTPPSNPPVQARVAVKAGTHLVTVAFLKKTSAVGEDVLRPFTRSGQGGSPAQPSLDSVTVSGPFNASGPGDTASRRRIFVCRPGNGAPETACAERILTTLATRAYRRPATPRDVRVLTAFYREGRAEGGFERGIQRALERLLVSPSFLFRIERAEGGPERSNNVWRVSDLELASRLSFFLWSSIPDDELLDVARRGTLSDPAVLERQVRRLLADPRSVALGENFAAQWLSLRLLDDATPDPRVFPDFDEGLRRSMRRETELFFDSVVRENRSVLDLLTAPDTFVNERLARHYGLPRVYGDGFKRVVRPDGQRTGVLGHASILTVTSYAHRTSPVLRGKWIMENVLGTPPPPPPPNVPTLVETNATTGKALTMREAMAQHRANPMCASCHGRMDPLGFAFENFDAVGRWRSVSADTPIDASGVLPDGATFEGTRGLLDIILKRPEQFAATFTERLLTYALGRGLEFYDAPAVRAIVRDAAPSGYSLAAIVTSVVKSVPFQMRARVSATGSSPSVTGASSAVAAK